MTYAEIVALALSYSDRSDTETSDRVDDFLKIVEARVNRQLKTMGAITRTDIPLVTGTDYYNLPSDFGGLREIKFRNSAGQDTTFRYTTPEMMDGLNDASRLAGYYYTIVGNQLRITPDQVTGDFIEIAYFANVPALTSIATTNWLSTGHPDCYVFGLVAEISAFAKDADAQKIWEARFVASVKAIDVDDSTNRWSGTPLETRLG